MGNPCQPGSVFPDSRIRRQHECKQTLLHSATAKVWTKRIMTWLKECEGRFPCRPKRLKFKRHIHRMFRVLAMRYKRAEHYHERSQDFLVSNPGAAMVQSPQ